MRGPLNAVMRVVLTAMLTACSGGERAERPAEAQRGGSVVVAEGFDIDKPMPIIGESVLDIQVNSILYRPLLQPWWDGGELHYVTHDRNPMALSRSYEFFGPDSASLRYRMVSDALWSDGQLITAHDAAWSITTQGDPRVGSPRQDYSRNIREVVVEDDSTLVIHFHRRNPEMFFHTAGGVSPRHPYEGTDLGQLRSHPAITSPVGQIVVSGPFILGEWVRGQRVVLVPNPNFQPQPNLERVIFRIVPEVTTRLIELQTGNVDVMRQFPFDQMESVRRQGNIRFERQQARNYDYIGYNPRSHEFFADRDIRRALGLAIDHEGLIRALQMEEFARPAGGPYSPIFRRLYDEREQAPLPFDPEQARQILASKGWTPGPDGILRRNGQQFRFTLITNADSRRRTDVAQIVQQQWRQIGVDARIQMIEFNTFIERQRTRNYEAMIAGWGVGLSPDLQQIWGDPNLPFNTAAYDNAQVRQLIQQALDQPTEDLAAPIWRQAAALIVADQPYTWLYYFDEPVAVRERVQDTLVNTLGVYQNLWEWWVTDASRTAATP